jgi:hypothetical protein
MTDLKLASTTDEVGPYYSSKNVTHDKLCFTFHPAAQRDLVVHFAFHPDTFDARAKCPRVHLLLRIHIHTLELHTPSFLYPSFAAIIKC